MFHTPSGSTATHITTQVKLVLPHGSLKYFHTLDGFVQCINFVTFSPPFSVLKLQTDLKCYCISYINFNKLFDCNVHKFNTFFCDVPCSETYRYIIIIYLKRFWMFQKLIWNGTHEQGLVFFSQAKETGKSNRSC